ncbi:hypothetical protein [Dyella sp. OK004]|uniref:hypothetical protein n=1 Tax=Dyella sp. OK004 TaxID=1855292 RepID=UPI0011608338|nr:hypothetical protein [Dyella sp. OK004]
MNRLACLAFALYFFCCLSPAIAACNSQMAKKAEEQASTLKTWSALHQSFKRYAACDDGAIAEGYSNSVATLLADWSDVVSLNRMVTKDKKFGDFVIKHIDWLMTPSQLESIDSQAGKSCPTEATALCGRIRERVSEIRSSAEQASPGKQ